MSALARLADWLTNGPSEVIDPTSPVSKKTPVIRLPLKPGHPMPVRCTLISRCPSSCPNIYSKTWESSRQAGTRFDTQADRRSGLRLHDVATDPDFLPGREHVERWIAEQCSLFDGDWLLYRTDRSVRRDGAARFLNDGHAPGISPHCSPLAADTSEVGTGAKTIGTDAKGAASLRSRRSIAISTLGTPEGLK